MEDHDHRIGMCWNGFPMATFLPELKWKKITLFTLYNHNEHDGGLRNCTGDFSNEVFLQKGSKKNCMYRLTRKTNT